MFKVNEYKIVFKRRWHEPRHGCITTDGRYDTKCEIYKQGNSEAAAAMNGVLYKKEPSFTGVAKLHPNDQPDKIIGKKIALRNAIGEELLGGDMLYSCQEFYNKSVRSAIWKAFWKWVESWNRQRLLIGLNEVIKESLAQLPKGMLQKLAEECALAAERLNQSLRKSFGK